MSQKIFSSPDTEEMKAPFANVPENWMLYDTILIGGYWSTVTPNVGYFQAYGTFGLNSEFHFFNTRNRSHGIPYNNQDQRDAMPYVMHIYGIGVTWFAPSTSTYASVNPRLGERVICDRLWQSEIPKHASVILRTNQDERLLANALMVPGGYGPVGSGIANGDIETNLGWTNSSVAHASYVQGKSAITNTWGFQKPLQIPRTANLSVVIRINTYCQNMLQQFVGPSFQPMKAIAADTTDYGARGCAGIQVVLRGKREVQQRGQYHA